MCRRNLSDLSVCAVRQYFICCSFFAASLFLSHCVLFNCSIFKWNRFSLQDKPVIKLFYWLCLFSPLSLSPPSFPQLFSPLYLPPLLFFHTHPTPPHPHHHQADRRVHQRSLTVGVQPASVFRCHGDAMESETVRTERMRSTVLQVNFPFLFRDGWKLGSD